MRIVVFGAGAVGSLLAARLAAAGAPVEIVARPAHVAAIRAHGLRVEGTGPGMWPVEAAERLRTGPAAAVIVTVKTFDLAAASEIVGRTVSPETPVVLLQNGLGVLPVASAGLRAGGWNEPDRFVVRGVNSLPATWVAPGVVRAAGLGELLLPSSEGSAERVRRLLEAPALTIRAVDDLPREEWRKAIVNAGINPVTALHGVVNGALAEGTLRDEALELLEEARGVAARAGFSFPRDEVEADFDRVVRATAANRSSMLQDVDRGRPTEIDAISGEILRVGTGLGVDLPATRRAIDAVRERVRRTARPQPS